VETEKNAATGENRTSKSRRDDELVPFKVNQIKLHMCDALLHYPNESVDESVNE
jgi:hypothetical protein